MAAVNIARFSIAGQTVLPFPGAETFIASMANATGGPITYRGFRIYFDAPPIPIRSFDWHFVHPDYDAERFSDGSFSDNGLCGDGASIADCMAQIDDLIAEGR